MMIPEGMAKSEIIKSSTSLEYNPDPLGEAITCTNQLMGDSRQIDLINELQALLTDENDPPPFRVIRTYCYQELANAFSRDQNWTEVKKCCKIGLSLTSDTREIKNFKDRLEFADSH
jgi:hypothetical protein